ncbi:hypothetical protein CGZ94_07425 [Enemella evansiae]|uniref:Alpha/beta hydrolase fold-3 domain-containing protein n=1 Tax=Enemella evansiae TaxID=2016499 RepID=A0A255GF04_9ACTN|nr:alpha/beta hydrolase fold domain-containing protein [Enemella evansiae]OYO07526.1 hypothetical protein CGZ98_18955 [Enemella evansiae]OYO14429.1 hypothetical protein CGZ94_07425 [Enemella evansiae]
MTSRAPLDPIVRAEIARRVATGDDPVPGTPMPERRERALRVNTDLWRNAGRPGPRTDTCEWLVPVPDAPDVRVRMHRPPGAGDRALPGVIALFGGAFRQGGIDYPSFDAAARERCVGAEVAILAVDYALAPELPFPNALEQVYAVLDQLARHGADHGIDPTGLAVTGASAGGNLAAAACLANRDRANHPVRLQLLEVPALDLTGGHLDRGVLSDLGGGEDAAMADVNEVVSMYLAGADPRNPLASPLLADSLAGLPPAYLMAAGLDPLVGDARAYLTRLLAEGTPASLFEAAGQTHESNSFAGISLAARHWEASVIAVLRTLHDAPGTVR